MRESIGGAWLTGIVITFVALFASFLTYAINYTKAFRVKNRVIQLIEESEGFTTYNGNDIDNLSLDQLNADNSAEAKIYYFVKKSGYNTEIGECPSGSIPGTNTYGYCLEKHCVNSENTDRVYYKVISYITLKIPIINAKIKVPIEGETTTMYFDSTGMDLTNSDHNCYK